MITLRVFSSIALILLAAITLPIAIYGAAMSAFGPKSYNPNSPLIASIEIVAITIIPAVAIWIPHKASLVLGGFLLILPTFLAICLIWIAPPAGIIGIIPMILWYFSAARYWKLLSLQKAEQGA